MTETLIRGQKGMASVKDMPPLQDGPPPGGFPPIRYARRIPNTGPSAVAVFTGAALIISYGLYQVGQGNKYRRAVKAEKIAGRQAIMPFLQAEEDLRFVKEYQKQLEEEARIMAHVPGWKVGENVYNSGRWMPPATGKLIGDYCRCLRIYSYSMSERYVWNGPLEKPTCCIVLDDGWSLKLGYGYYFSLWDYIVR